MIARFPINSSVQLIFGKDTSRILYQMAEYAKFAVVEPHRDPVTLYSPSILIDPESRKRYFNIVYMRSIFPSNTYSVYYFAEHVSVRIGYANDNDISYVFNPSPH